MATWTPIRHSLETAAITLFAGFIGWRYLDLWLSVNLLRHRTRLPKLRDPQSLSADKRLTKDMGILLHSNIIKSLPVLSFRTVLWIWMSCWPPTHRLRKGCMLQRP